MDHPTNDRSSGRERQVARAEPRGLGGNDPSAAAMKDRTARLAWRHLGATVALVALVALGTAGCTSSGSGGAPPPGHPSGRLSRFDNCGELLATIRQDARLKVSIQADQLREQGAWVREGGGEPPIFSPGPEPMPVDDGAPDDFTDTNVQVAGVDEADVLETDGQRIFLLHGSELIVAAAWPPSALAVSSRLALEGSPVGLFVDGDRAAIVSSIWDDGRLGGDDSCGGLGGPLPRPMLLEGDVGAPIACGTPFTKITLADLSDGAPRVTREVYVEGYYSGARRHGDAVRVITQRGWGSPITVPEPWVTLWGTEPPADEAAFDARVDQWKEQALAAIDQSSLDGWLPAIAESRPGGGLGESALACSDVHIPAAGVGEDGSSSIVALDLDDPTAEIRSTLVMGGASTVFASLDTMVLVSPQWGAFAQGEESDRSALHLFALAGFETNYQASGFVAGQTPSSFALDTADGILRVATTVTTLDQSGTSTETSNRITTLRAAGEGLEVVGATPDLAPGERIFGVRFLGDLGYLVTFRQIDPLFVIDLADPAAPTVLGEVELPGFSEYIHPLGDGHLLTIGRDADETGRTRGVALRIFDVTDPTAPRLAHVELLAGEGWTPAETDHLAFTYDSRLGLLALPFNRWHPNWAASLLLYDVDPDAGFRQVAEILDPGPVGGPDCIASDVAVCGPQAEMRRGLFIEDHVYAWSTTSLRTHALADPAAPVAVVPLPDLYGAGPEPVIF